MTYTQPPGTGKTMLAKALATEAKCHFCYIKCSDLLHELRGQSVKSVKRVFEQARGNRPAVIFFDELDSLLVEHSSHGYEAIVAEFKVQMEGASADNTDIVFLGASNKPWKLEEAIWSRFQVALYIDLPSEEDRKMMFETCRDDVPDLYCSHLALETEGYSGRDIINVINTARGKPNVELHTAEYFKRVDAGFEPCEKDDDGAEPMTIADVPEGKAQARRVTVEDFLSACEEVHPTVTEEQLRKFKEFKKPCCT